MKDEDKLCEQTLLYMECTVNNLARLVPHPKRIPYRGCFVFRHVEKTVHQALVQKLARLVSSLCATRLLMMEGFVQEQGAMQRIVDEIQEDITFLSYGVIFDQRTRLHDDYLAAFFEEEFDANSAVGSTQSRQMIPRKRIRAWITEIETEAGLDRSQGVDVMRTISKFYSGYVHAASPHIMDMFIGTPPEFHMRGMLGTPRHIEYRIDMMNYFYRGIVVFGFAAKAFGDDEIFARTGDLADEFMSIFGKNYK